MHLSQHDGVGYDDLSRKNKYFAGTRRPGAALGLSEKNEWNAESRAKARSKPLSWSRLLYFVQEKHGQKNSVPFSMDGWRTDIRWKGKEDDLLLIRLRDDEPMKITQMFSNV